MNLPQLAHHNSADRLAPQFLSLGRRAYQEVWAEQKRILQEVIAGRMHDTVIVCEHEPVITIGTSGKPESLRVEEGSLQAKGIPVYHVERGGDVTYHGPGQLVVYPILDLRQRRQDVGWYMRSLEEVAIRCLSAFGISAHRVQGKTGLWTFSAEEPGGFQGRKIASLGVRISHWCTMHGLSLNVQDCEHGFDWIFPCGFRTIEITSMKRESRRSFNMEEVERMFVNKFLEVFG